MCLETFKRALDHRLLLGRIHRRHARRRHRSLPPSSLYVSQLGLRWPFPNSLVSLTLLQSYVHGSGKSVYTILATLALFRCRFPCRTLTQWEYYPRKAGRTEGS